MKRWVITGVIVALLALAGLSAHWWLPSLFPLLKTKNTEIDSASKILSGIGAAVAFLIRLWLDRRERQKQSGGANVGQTAQGGGINVAGPASAAGDMVARDKITIIQQGPAAAQTPTSSLHQVPPQPRDFTGREEEIPELMEAVGSGGVTIYGLQGMGGVGKTALALKLAEQLAPRYPDAQFYLELKGVSKEPLLATKAMEHVIRAYHPGAKIPEDEAALSGLYQSVLHSQKALLLMDNARDARQIEPLIPPPSCMLLVTSRQRFTLPGLVPKHLDALPPADARALMLRIATRLTLEKEENATELAKLCGYLPLAIRTVASALAARLDLHPADMVRRLADNRARLKLTETDASLQSSYDLLTEDMKKQFRALAVFPDSFYAAGAAAVWETESDPAKDALGELLVYSLLEFNRATGRYRLHDLVRVFAEARLESAERAVAEKRHAEHYKNVLAAADQLYQKGGESVKQWLGLFDLEWGNIQAGQTWAAKHANEDKEAAQLGSQYPDAGAYCLELRLRPRERIGWLEAGLAAARQLKDRNAEGTHLGNLGNAYQSLGEYRRAIEFLEQRQKIAREFGDRRGEGTGLGNLGNAYFSLGESRRAIESYEQRLQIAREVGDRRGEGNGLCGLGLAYHSLGEDRRAIEYLEQSLNIARKIGDRRGEEQALGNLGNAYQSLGEYRRAIQYHEKALVIDREIGDRRGEGTDLGNLGNAYFFLGEYRRAIEYHEQHLKIAREIGDRHGEGNALGNLGLAYDSLGEYRRAIEYHEQDLKIAHEIGDRRGEGNALWNTSLALDKLGNRAKAIANAESALNILEQIESTDAAKARTQLAQWRERT